jgi:hypothetical protein
LNLFEQALVIQQALADENPHMTEHQGRVAGTLVGIGAIHRKAGRPRASATVLRRAVDVMAGIPTKSPENLYSIACGHALLAGLASEPESGLTPADANREAEDAVSCLRRAAAAGFRNLDLMRTDTDLDPLRARTDFRLLIMDLAFPADPFAR